MGRAIQQVVEAHHPNIKLNVIETVGSIDNLQRLEFGEGQLVTAQADVAPSPKTRAIATLYRDLFQLVVSPLTLQVSGPRVYMSATTPQVWRLTL